MTALPQNLAQNPILSRWIGFTPDGRITVRTGKVELGQGSVTAIAAIAAAELSVEISAINVIAGDTRFAPDEGFTAGSLSIEQGGAAMRHVAALVRTLFADRAAAALNCPRDALIISDGYFACPASNESLSYADLANSVDLEKSAATLPAPDFSGATIPQTVRLDLAAKLSGGAFIHDLTPANLHYGRVLRPPRSGAKLVSIDREALEKLPGIIKAVVDGSFIGLIGRREDEVDKALVTAAALVRWDGPTLPVLDDENRWMESAKVVAVLPVISEADSQEVPFIRLEAAYSRPYIAHASIGPSCAMAEWNAGKLTVWSHTQGVFPLKAQLARALGVAPDVVDVIHAMGAGCYGHNGADDVALDAALLARAVLAPVLCRWTRADELVWSPFGAPMRMKLAADLDASGKIVAWHHDVWSPPHVARPGFGSGVNLLAAAHLAKPRAPSPEANFPGPAGGGDRNAVPHYKVGQRKITHHLLPQGPLRSSALRSLGAHGNVFAIESFMDELATVAGLDPVAFRLAHLDDPRARAVIEAAAKAANWNTKEAGGEGNGRGIGFARYKNLGGYCATVARIELTDIVRVMDVHVAVDCGAVINRDGLINQIEGGIVQAISWTLKEQVRWSEEGVITRSWADYPILGFAECPEIHVTILEPEGAGPLGAGECASGPLAGAIANAIAHALGVRVRHMPLNAARIEATINAQSS